MADKPADLADARKRAIKEIRKQYPPLLTSAHVAELMSCTIGEVRDQVHRGDLPAVRWGQQFRFFREEVLAVLLERPAGPDMDEGESGD
ncbi:MAG: helix-turn-helix domain-containing protein [Acidimicrobiia bacterium]